LNDPRHDPKRALALMREAMRLPIPVCADALAEVLLPRLLSADDIAGIPVDAEGKAVTEGLIETPQGLAQRARIDAAWPSAPRVGRPRKQSRWRGAYWQNFGQARARAAAVSQRRVDGAPLRKRIEKSVQELMRLRIPRQFWVALLARGIGKGALDDVVPRLTHAFGIRNYASVRSMLSRSSLPRHGLGRSEHQIRLTLKALESLVS
jgi:hypothetical protein